MLLIIGFCSVLNKKKVTEAISLKVGPAHTRVCTHIHTTHTREEKKHAKKSYVFLTAHVKIKFQEITIAVTEIMVQNFFCQNHLIQVKTKSYGTCH